MRARLRSGWQPIKQHPFIATGIIVALFAIIVFTLVIYTFGLDWTGFTSVAGPTLTSNEQYRPAKTLWDVLQLLIIPLILAVGGFWLNQIQNQRDQKAQAAQKQREESAAKEREKLERESREDNQRETALQAYLDKMSELLLDKNNPLRDSKSTDAIRAVAQARTLTVLSRLDPVRIASVLHFLSSAGLTTEGNSICTELAKCNLRATNLFRVELPKVNLYQADLREVDFYYANLYHAYLRKADLRKASLFQARLVGADLQGADLSEADLRNADLRGADLSKANLNKARLDGAKLDGANLSEANLNGASLKDATGITLEQLYKAKSLQSAAKPDGSIHP